MELTDRIREALKPHDAPWIRPPTLLPLGRVLDLVGESLSERLITVSGLAGPEQCLRPDMTLPTALHYAAEDAGRAQAYRYSGRVYRAPRPGGSPETEIATVGMERFGDDDAPTADAEVLAIALDACAAIDLPPLSVKMTDLAVFKAMIEAFAPDRAFAARLNSMIARPRQLRRSLEGPQLQLGADDPARALIDLPPEEAKAAARAIASAGATGTLVGRTVEQIADRLVDKAAAARTPAVSPDALRFMDQLLKIKGGPERVLAKRQALFETFAIPDGGYLERAGRRIAAIRALQPELEIYVDPGFEANFWYYDDFLFSIRRSQGGSQVVAAGGRYDTLVSRVTQGAVSAPAIGCSLLVSAIREIALPGGAR